MKGNTRMKKRLGIIGNLLRYKNRQIKLERERAILGEEVNRILATYLALFISKDEVRVSCEEISATLGKYRAVVSKEGEDYLIKVIPCVCDGTYEKK